MLNPARVRVLRAACDKDLLLCYAQAAYLLLKRQLLQADNCQ